MAIFGIGAYYDYDVTDDFLKHGYACVGWKVKEAPPAHSILRHLRTGDIIFIKTYTPKDGLTIKAVGIVKEGKVSDINSFGSCVPVQWVWQGDEKVGLLNDKWPVRTVAIFEEHHPEVQNRVISLLLNSGNKAP